MTTESIVAEVGARMRALGLNPKRLSIKAGLGETYVRDLLTGRSKNPKTEQLNQLMDTLDRLEAAARDSLKRGADSSISA